MASMQTALLVSAAVWRHSSGCSISSTQPMQNVPTAQRIQITQAHEFMEPARRQVFPLCGGWVAR
jgi:hypothetical protein